MTKRSMDKQIVRLTRFTAMNIDELPVVAPDDKQRILGILRRKETIAAYNRRRLEHKLVE